MDPQPVFSVPRRAPVLSAWTAVHAWIETQTHLRVQTHSAQVGTPLSLCLAYCFTPSERPWSPVYARLGAWKTRRFAMFRQLAPRGSERDPVAGSMPRKAGPPHTLIVIMLVSRTWTRGGESCVTAPLECSLSSFFAFASYLVLPFSQRRHPGRCLL
jgi:hypothetical protein